MNTEENRLRHNEITIMSNHDDKPTRNQVKLNQIASIQTKRYCKQHDSEREGAAIKRLSDALTGGNASTWEQIFNAAENVAEVRKTLVDALRFYADRENYINDVLGLPDGSSEVEGSSAINQDGGLIAYNALAKIKQ